MSLVLAFIEDRDPECRQWMPDFTYKGSPSARRRTAVLTYCNEDLFLERKVLIADAACAACEQIHVRL